MTTRGTRSRSAQSWIVKRFWKCLTITKPWLSLKTMYWSTQWLNMHWAALCSGKRIEVAFLVHPTRFGFRRLSIALNIGQAEDWGLSLPDGSRIHVWLMRDGRWIAHRDATDPSLSPLHAVVHALTATPLGALALLGIVGLTAVAVSRA